MKTRILIILKPDCLEKGVEAEVKKIFQFNGWTIVAERKIEKVSTELLSSHYNEVGKLRERLMKVGPEFADHVIKLTFDYMMRGPIVPLVIEKEVEDVEEAIAYLRNHVIGVTKPWRAEEGSIRELYGNKDESHEPIENVVHCSGNLEEALQEIALWFPKL
jgi:nucleoside diphosphate kinase